jgi:hypothetical protein
MTSQLARFERLLACLICLSCQSTASSRSPQAPHAATTETKPTVEPTPSPRPMKEPDKASNPLSVLELIRGTWGWTVPEKLSCTENPHTIEVSVDGTEMILSHAHPHRNFTGKVSSEPTHYDVGHVVADRVRMNIRGEQRTTPTGELVAWDLIMLSPNEYCWRRTDWEATSCTPSIVRCSPHTASVAQ